MKRLFLHIVLIFSVLSCKDNDDNISKNDHSSNVDLAIKDFIWKGLNQYYLWQTDVPDLADDKFASSVAKTNLSNPKYVHFLNSVSDNELFFYKLLHKPSKLFNSGYVDRFSYIVDDYRELEESKQGVVFSSGMSFLLSRYGNQNGVLGVVRYVLPNSEAEQKGVTRGDIFLSVDGTPLNINNYERLLFNDKTSMTIDINRLQNQTIVPLNKTISMVKSKIVENPILIKKVIVRNQKKIGYLMYNGFVANFDKELNNVFAEFKSEGVTDLILDLRYNGGGRVSSAVHLSSMILGSQLSGKLFAKERWNHKIQAYVEKRQGTDDFLTSTMITDQNESIGINHLNMSKIYVLTSERTASASELVINGLKPYIEVIQIGTRTTGKNVGSITIYDEDNKGTRNPRHRWAMQPLTLKIENANGFGDYTDGLVPTYLMEEDLSNMGELGDENEPLLAQAIRVIVGGISDKHFPPKAKMPVSPIADSKTFNLGMNGMYK
ncbi:MAG: S41 family peptidase [Bacteroidota bacterium]|nr:S41 family peptidase [Bacteroidota bacterium]